jgi:lipopolysaccharide biosynthesis protein
MMEKIKASMGKEKLTSANGIDQVEVPHFLTKEGGEGGKLLRLHATAVICHLHYPDLLDELVNTLEPLEGNFDLYLSIPRDMIDLVPAIFARFPTASILPMENIGRDINPFLVILKAIMPLGYESLLKIHTKRSPHRAVGDVWRQDMYARLLGNRENVLKIQQRLEIDKHVGMIAPKGHVVSYRAFCGTSRDRVLAIANATGVAYAEEHDFPFVAGTMFWAKPQALIALIRIPAEQLQYEDEVIAPEGALLHALERFIGLAVYKTGMEILETDGQGVISRPDLTQPYPYTLPSKLLKPADIHKVVFFSSYDERFAIEHMRVTGPYLQAGIEVIEGIVNGEACYDLIPGADAVVIQREFPRNLPVYDQIYQVANEHYIPMIYDLDDLLFNLPDDHPERQAMAYSSALMPMLSALMQADLVTMSTGKLKETLHDFNENIQVLPNYLDDNLWKVNPPRKADPYSDRVTIGYMGSASHTPDLEMITPVLVELLAKYGDRLRLHIWGTELPEKLRNNPQVTHTPAASNNYREFAAYFQQQEADIFIAPLADNLFNRCKSGLKFLEYSALGVAGVYSNLDGYAEMITHGQDGFLADSPAEWRDYLVRLIEVPALRADMAAKAQQTIQEKWLLSKNISSWKDIFKVEEPGFNHQHQAKMTSSNLIHAMAGQLFWMQAARDELVRDLNRRNESLEGALETSEVARANEHNLLESEQAALANEHIALEVAREKLAKERKELVVVRGTLAKLETRFQAEQKEYQVLVERSRSQAEQIDALNAQMATGQATIHLLENKQGHMSATVDELKRQLQERETEQQHLAGLVDGNVQQNQGLTEELNARSRELVEIKASRSWKLALLLRKMRSKVAPVDGKLTRTSQKISFYLFKPISRLWQKVRLNRDLSIIEKSALFNKEWYLATYPDVLKNGANPARHYMFFGAFEGRDPGPNFSSSEYLNSYPDVKDAHINPLVHYLKFGANEGRNPNGITMSKVDPERSSNDHEIATLIQPVIEDSYYQAYKGFIEAAETGMSQDFIPFQTNEPIPNEGAIKPIAFYLPQFHPFPENDTWWGKGFTEWTNVSKAIPQFTGHYQPRLPGELGFYDLRLYEVQQRQIELACNYGIYGFCFHYYWFSGRRLLERPMNLFLDHSENEFPFCVCWANENWTRRWDGKEDDVLIAQEHSFENDKRFIADLEPILKDKRYIRINGRPIIIIYRPELIKKPFKTAEYWREYCEGKSLGNPLIIGAQTFGFTDPTKIGFDASVEFPPHNIVYSNINHKIKLLNKDYQGSVYDYREMVEKNVDPINYPFKVFRTATPSWDNEARKPGRGFSFVNSTPKLYRQWLDQISFEEMAKHPHEDNFVFINAWNEWGESAYLEPDRKFGYAYLQATYEAVLNSSRRRFLLSSGEFVFMPTKTKDTLVILHAYYTDLFDEIAGYLENITDGFDLIVSLPESEKDFSKTIFMKFPHAQIFLAENKGRDIAPFIEIFRCISSLKYKTLLKIHTKKSIHREDGTAWRHDILDKLLGSADTVQKIKDELSNNGNVGLVAPKNHVLDHRVYWGFNKNKTLKLAKETGINVVGDPDFIFIAGSMFWANPEALNFLNVLPVNSLDFEPEPTPPDGALAHAIERLIGLATKVNGFSIKEIDAEGNIIDPGEGNAYAYALPFPQ